jgi:hypothetical protein
LIWPVLVVPQMVPSSAPTQMAALQAPQMGKSVRSTAFGVVKESAAWEHWAGLDSDTAPRLSSEGFAGEAGDAEVEVALAREAVSSRTAKPGAMNRLMKLSFQVRVHNEPPPMRRR